MKRYLGLLLLSIALCSSYEKVKAVSIETFYFSTDKTAANDSVITWDDKLFYEYPSESGDIIYNASLGTSIDSTFSTNDMVILEKNEDTSIFIDSAFTCSMDIQINWWDASGTRHVTIRTLTVSYDPTLGKPFNFRSVYKFVGAHKITAEILSVNYIQGGITETPKAIFRLSAQIVVKRSYKFNCSTVPAPSCGYNSTTNQAEISWSPVQGADEYDLEYTYYDLGDPFIRKFTNSHAEDYNFTPLFINNATRVTLNDPDYFVSLLSDTGYLFYRVRAVKLLSNGDRIVGSWTTDVTEGSHDNGTGLFWYFYGHQPKLNWQYSAAFAEEGKSKEVMSYFDGSLRNRQSVTLMNSSPYSAIAGETIYDYQGRPAVKTLPVPTNVDRLDFYNNFNTYNGYEYNRDYFDTGSCDFFPYLMDSTRSNSASWYYSSKDSLKSGFNRYIPDALGYPFTITEYTDDNTGRINRQSGAGKIFMLGSGHETKYYYGKPTQEELDRLFGNAVGFSSHYLKNMVVDPDTQISVSYIDAHGRVIATALAGISPTNLQTLPSNTGVQTMTTNLLDSSQIANPDSIVCNYSLLATNQGWYKFKYNLTPDKFNVPCGSICYDCLYDMKIIITDNCGNAFNSGQPYIYTQSNYSLTPPLDTSCSTSPEDIYVYDSLYLAPGQYNITKTLTVSSFAINYYTTHYLMDNTCLRTFQSFYDSAVANTNFSGCNLTCASCLAALGTEANYLTTYITTLTDSGYISTHRDTVVADSLYGVYQAQCNAICNGPNQCQQLYQEMVNDVNMGGQYGGYSYDTTSDTYSNNTDPTSVFYTNYDWQHPCTPYLNDAGQPDSIYIPSLGNVPPQDASNVNINLFLQNWKLSWAASLVCYHPEYCYYNWCIDNDSSQIYDQEMLNTNDYASATTEGLTNPLGITPSSLGTVGENVPTNTSNRDPFFQDEGGVSAKSFMINRLENYYTVTCSGTPSSYSAWFLSSLIVNPPAAAACPYTTPPFGSGCVGDQDEEWRSFRALYESVKDSLYDVLREEHCGADSSNCCIGSALSSVQHMSCSDVVSGICSGGSTLYASKMPRVFHASLSTVPFNISDPDNDASNASTYFTDSLTMQCDSSCADNANNWLASIDSCPTYKALSALYKDSIKIYMIKVCENGCDVNNIYGASSGIPTAVTDNGHKFNSFEDVFVYFTGVSYQDSACSAYYITFPPEYNSPASVQTGDVVLMTKDSCICSKVNLYDFIFKSDSLAYVFIKKTDPYANFTAFLDSQLHIQIADSVVTGLLNICNINSTCTYLPYPVTVPGPLTCNACITCTDVSEKVDAFEVQFGYTTDTAKFHVMLTAYLNQVFGFQETYGQYMAFIQDCGEPLPMPISVSPITPCSNLIIPVMQYTGQFARFYTTYPDPTHIIGVVSLSNTTNVGSVKFVKPSQAWNTLQTDTADTAVTVLLQLYTPVANDTVNVYTASPSFSLDANTVKWIKSNTSVCSGLENPIDSTKADSIPALSASIVPFSIDTVADTAKASLPQSLVSGVVTWVSVGVADTDTVLTYPPPTLCADATFPFTAFDTSNCRDELLSVAFSNAQLAYNNYIDSIQNTFQAQYVGHCMNAAEQFTLSYPFNEYHYTLYYYDQAGNLVKTVPPKGVQPFTGDTITWVESHRDSALDYPTAYYPENLLYTNYYYNTLNQLTKQVTPDADTTRFWYDLVGRLVVSRNAKQRQDGLYSYTIYDALGRIIEVGQIRNSTAMTDAISRSASSLSSWLSAGYKGQVTSTYYDNAVFTIPNFTQQNLRSRVASVTYRDTILSGVDSTHYNYATHYTYDVDGNVSSIIQDLPPLATFKARYKRINYNYYLVSGNVNEVLYQQDSVDQFLQAYVYDADNRITNVMTSTDSLLWDNDASYYYYPHGILARTEIGERQVQGIDYAYTLQGWPKAVNSNSGNDSLEMGKDGFAHMGNPHTLFARDAYGFVLGYYNGDYKPIDTTIHFEMKYNGSDFDNGSPGLYNGNIRNMSIYERALAQRQIGYAYKYDQLNRYMSMDAYTNLDSVTNRWQSSSGPITSFKERVSYDPNGNILTYLRHGNTAIGSVAMDSLTYNYYTKSNKLSSVNDGVPATNYPNDIDDEVEKNYKYDTVGDMVFDSSEHLVISWNMRGKVRQITNNNKHLIVKFDYDALGNRVMKKDSDLTTNTDRTTWYIRDVQGNELATYLTKVTYSGGSVTSDSLWLKEWVIYGKYRLGVWHIDSLLYPRTTSPKLGDSTISYFEGGKEYELTNHLGNVLATISDKKMPVENGASGLIAYYLSEILSSTDYYSFGMPEPGRTFSLTNDTGYHYGFNGKYKDNDIEGNGNILDFGARIYDSRLDIFNTVDSDFQKYTSWSPYVFVLDDPIRKIDPNGKGALDNFYRDSQGNLLAVVRTNQNQDNFYTINNQGNISYNTSRQRVNTWNSLNDEQKNEVVNRANMPRFTDPMYQNDFNGVDPTNRKLITQQQAQQGITGGINQLGGIVQRNFAYYEGKNSPPFIVFNGAVPNPAGMMNNLVVPNLPTPQAGTTVPVPPSSLPPNLIINTQGTGGSVLPVQETTGTGTFIPQPLPPATTP